MLPESGPGGRSIAVIGAGIIGVCCALYLRKAGFEVDLIDPDEPGMNCSFGAAGNLGGNAHVPLRDIVWQVPGMLLDRDHPFEMRFQDIPMLLPWLGHYIRAAAPAAQAEISQAAGAISRLTYPKYVELLTDAGEPGLIRKNGRFFVWTSDKGFAKDQHALEVRRSRGIKLEMLSGDEVREREPAISTTVRHGAFVAEAGFILNPLRLTKLLAADFVGRGGRIRRERVRAFVFDDADRPSLVTDSGASGYDQVVVAAGIWSRDLVAQIGSKIPLVPERGYHAMFPDPVVKPSVSVLWEDRKVIFTPMEHGLRASGIAEFAAKEAKPRYQFADRLVETTKVMFPGVNTDNATRWMGPRPVTPDYIPVIGRSPIHSRVIFAFGHGHSGYNIGPPTGHLVTQIATDTKPDIDLHAFRPDRWQ